MVLNNKKDLFAYVNGLLSQISENTSIPKEELMEIFVNYNKNSEERKSYRIERKKPKTKNTYLEYIVIDKMEYLVDNIKNKVYSFDKEKKYIGVYNIDNDSIDFA